MDITYIRLARGCVYLVAVIDGSSSTVLAWRVSNTLDHGFCVERLWRSVKCKDIDLRGYATLPELLAGLMDYFVWSNTERRHQSWDDVIPDEVYRTASGGGARIVDQFGKTEHMPPDTQQETERRCSAVPLHGTGYPLTLKA